MKVIVEYDVDNYETDDKINLMRALKATDMAIVLFEIGNLFRSARKNENLDGKEIDPDTVNVLEDRFHQLKQTYDINLDNLLE